jgi:hypothetical protein
MLTKLFVVYSIASFLSSAKVNAIVGMRLGKSDRKREVVLKRLTLSADTFLDLTPLLISFLQKPFATRLLWHHKGFISFEKCLLVVALYVLGIVVGFIQND